MSAAPPCAAAQGSWGQPSAREAPREPPPALRRGSPHPPPFHSTEPLSPPAAILCTSTSHLTTSPPPLLLPSLPSRAGLRTLILARNGLEALPAALCALTALKVLDVAFNAIEGLPEGFGALVALETVRGRGCASPPVPLGAHRCAALRVSWRASESESASDCGQRRLPSACGEVSERAELLLRLLLAEELCILVLNSPSTLPPPASQVSLEGNCIKDLAPLAPLANLVTLNVDGNMVTSLDELDLASKVQ